MLSHLSGQGVPESFDESGAVLVQEPDETDRAFLRVPVGEDERARPEKLSSKRVVFSLGVNRGRQLVSLPMAVLATQATIWSLTCHVLYQVTPLQVRYSDQL